MKIVKYRRRPACSSWFKFHLSSFTFLSVLCLLTSVLCQPSRAGGSWLVDGQAVQTLEVQTTNADPNALYTDGTRTMQAPLVFEQSVSNLFRAYTPWDGMYDFFILDADLEAVKLCAGSTTFYPTRDLYISGTTLGDDSGGGGSVDIGEMTLKGGTWQVDAVGPYAESIISRDFADNRYHQKSAITTPLKFDPSLSSSVNGLFKATVPWDAEYEFFTFNPTYETVVLSPTVASLGFEAANLAMHGYGVISMPAEGSYISFEERSLGGGGWVAATVLDDPSAIMNRSYADNRYHQKSLITTPLVFDPSLSSSVNGLFKATVPWDSEYDFFTFNSATESVVLSPTVASLGFEVASLSIHGYGVISMPDEGSYISFEERSFGGGGWVMPAVMDDPSAIINRTYADTRYIQRTEGITTNHTFQVGDVLQIQNGIITAINP